jgi:hypothetical protein
MGQLRRYKKEKDGILATEYRHDMPFIEGTNVWVQFDWDKKCKLVLESLFVAPAFLQQQNRIRTPFFRY